MVNTVTKISNLITDRDKIKALNCEESQELYNIEIYNKLVALLDYDKITMKRLKELNDKEFKLPTVDGVEYTLNKENNFRAFIELTDTSKLTTVVNQLSDNSTNDLVRSLAGSNLLVISKNPIDFIMCSTNQPFKSCYALDSAYGYMWGLPALVINDSLYIAYLTKRKKKNYSFKDTLDKPIKHFEMRARWFMYELLSETGEVSLGMGNMYPKQDSPASFCANGRFRDVIKNYITEADLKLQETLDGSRLNKDWHIPYIHEQVNPTKSYRAVPYLDDIRLSSIQVAENSRDIKVHATAKATAGLRSGSGTGFLNCLPLPSGFTAVQLLKSNTSLTKHALRQSNSGYNTTHNCYGCEEEFDCSNMTYIHAYDSYLCEDCFDNADDIVRCDECNEYVYADNTRNVGFNQVCDTCIEDLFESDEITIDFRTGDIKYILDGDEVLKLVIPTLIKQDRRTPCQTNSFTTFSHVLVKYNIDFVIEQDGYGNDIQRGFHWFKEGKITIYGIKKYNEYITNNPRLTDCALYLSNLMTAILADETYYNCTVEEAIATFEGYVDEAEVVVMQREKAKELVREIEKRKINYSIKLNIANVNTFELTDKDRKEVTEIMVSEDILKQYRKEI